MDFEKWFWERRIRGKEPVYSISKLNVQLQEQRGGVLVNGLDPWGRTEKPGIDPREFAQLIFLTKVQK